MPSNVDTMTSTPSQAWRGTRARLLWKDVSDPLRWRFGARAHRYRLHRPLAVATLEAFERERRVSLPADYKSFLSSVGNGGAGPYYGLLPFEQALGAGDVGKPFPLTEAFTPVPDDDHDIPACYQDGYLVLSDMGCAYFSFLVVTGPAAGTVWNNLVAGGGGFRPTGQTFAGWYEAWLRG